VALKEGNLLECGALDRDRGRAREAAAEQAFVSNGHPPPSASSSSSSSAAAAAASDGEGGQGKVDMVRLKFRRSPFGCEDHVVRCGSGRPLSHVKELLAKQVGGKHHLRALAN
jgi:hypothetical protein